MTTREINQARHVQNQANYRALCAITPPRTREDRSALWAKACASAPLAPAIAAPATVTPATKAKRAPRAKVRPVAAAPVAVAEPVKRPSTGFVRDRIRAHTAAKLARMAAEVAAAPAGMVAGYVPTALV